MVPKKFKWHQFQKVKYEKHEENAVRKAKRWWWDAQADEEVQETPKKMPKKKRMGKVYKELQPRECPHEGSIFREKQKCIALSNEWVYMHE